jgi:hypothetical protein
MVTYLYSGVLNPAIYIILVFLGAITALWGKQLLRLLTAVLFSGFLAYISWKYTGTPDNFILPIILSVLGLLVGLGVGFLLPRLSVSIIASYIVASITANYVEVTIYLFLALIVIYTLILYGVGRLNIYALYALAGAIMAFRGLTMLELNTLVALIICAVLGVVGYYNQRKRWI